MLTRERSDMAGRRSTAPSSEGSGEMPYVPIPIRTRSRRDSGIPMEAAVLAA